jgi:DNA polymerase
MPRAIISARKQARFPLATAWHNMSNLNDLYRDIAACQRCSLHKNTTHAVPGEGPENSQIMFIGEAPGFHEDQQGRPFVGAAGQFLEHLLSLIHLTREQVYIANVVKHRPPNNREPLPGELLACRPWLTRQIELISPKMIVTLGRYSMDMFFPGKSVSKIHGTGAKQNGVIYFAMYHPAAALHQQNLRQQIEQDMLKIPALLAELTAPPAEAKPSAEQLKMF